MTNYTTSAGGTDLVLTRTKNGVSKSVTVQIIKETENLTKGIIPLNPPQTTNNQPDDIDNASYGMKIIDILNKVDWRLTLVGYLDTDGTLSAEQKRTRLRNMFLAGGVQTITTYGGTFDGLTCAIDKLEFERVSADNIAGEGIATYQVTISLLIGTQYGQ